MHKHLHLPRPGMRAVKSAVAVGLCLVIYALRGFQGIPFYSALAALQCMQPYHAGTKKMALQRLTGTLIGSVYGLFVLLLQIRQSDHRPGPYLLYCLAVSLGVVAALYTAVALHKKNAAYFSGLVFLSITVVHIGDENPYLFVCNRLLDTLIGVAVGMAVNEAHLPLCRRRAQLLVTGLDDVMLPRTAALSDDTRVRLNRMLDDGLPLSVMTMRTLASFLEATAGVRFRLPVILMDGAALYDPAHNTFLEKRELPARRAGELVQILQECGLCCFANVIVGNSVLIFYGDLPDGTPRQMVEKLQVSPYRNYLHRPLPPEEPVAYLMAMDRTCAIQAANARLQAEQGEDFRILCYPSDEYPGYSYLKIYRKDATKLEMLQVLQQRCGFATVRTFGSLAGVYDEYIPDAGGATLVRRLRRADRVWPSRHTTR